MLRLERALRGVEELRRAALAAEQEFGPDLEAVAPSLRESAYNLVHYLAVRRHDVRQAAGQPDAARLELPRPDGGARHGVAAGRVEALSALRGKPVSLDLADEPPVTFDTGDALLAEHANAILGAAPSGRETRVMVTMPGDAADDPGLIRGLLEAGMGIMRINCAHDDPRSGNGWSRICVARNEKRPACLVSFDLAGPKLRTGPMAPGPAVRQVATGPGRDGSRHRAGAHAFRRPHPRARRGELDDPGRQRLLAKARPGDTIVLADTRESQTRAQGGRSAAGRLLCTKRHDGLHGTRRPG